jgi:hypothetical protein
MGKAGPTSEVATAGGERWRLIKNGDTPTSRGQAVSKLTNEKLLDQGSGELKGAGAAKAAEEALAGGFAS